MNQVAQAFIKSHEGCKLTAYQDGGGVWTIGYGATGPEVVRGLTWTQEQADQRLAADMAKVESGVRRLVVIPLSIEQMAALISFCFNLGLGALEKSSVLLPCIKDGDFIGAAKQFSRYDHDGGVEVRGLLIRRFEEAALFLKGS